MPWVGALLALLVSHAVGDVLRQTDWQALNEVTGLVDPVGRRALFRHPWRRTRLHSSRR
jgi:hypothetical protein